MKNAPLYPWLSYVHLFILFCIDLWSFFFMGHPTFFLVLAYLLASLFNQPFSLGLTGWAFLLISSEATTMIGLPFWYIILTSGALLCVILFLRHHLFFPLYGAALALGCYTMLDLLVFQPLLKGLPPEKTYTIGIIFANMIVTMLFSLKLKTGKIRQSLALKG